MVRPTDDLLIQSHDAVLERPQPVGHYSHRVRQSLSSPLAQRELCAINLPQSWAMWMLGLDTYRGLGTEGGDRERLFREPIYMQLYKNHAWGTYATAAGCCKEAESSVRPQRKNREDSLLQSRYTWTLRARQIPCKRRRRIVKKESVCSLSIFLSIAARRSSIICNCMPISTGA